MLSQAQVARRPELQHHDEGDWPGCRQELPEPFGGSSMASGGEPSERPAAATVAAHGPDLQRLGQLLCSWACLAAGQRSAGGDSEAGAAVGSWAVTGSFTNGSHIDSVIHVTCYNSLNT